MVLTPFLYALRAYKIPVGTQEWLYLMEALSEDLTDCQIDRFYFLARAVLVKSEALYDAFDQAFLECFKNHTGTINFKEELLDWLNRVVDEKNRPKLPSGIEKLALDELLKKFQERLKEQKEAHHGGNYWIGTGGTSPFGHSGAHPSGIRIGGPGGGRSAVKVAEERRFQNYRHDRVLDTRQLKVALKRLRKFDREGVVEELQLEKSIEATCKNAGDIELVFEPPRKNQSELLLLMDVGGSMDSYAVLVENLFSAAHASNHFKAFRHYYFHNCIYQKVYTDIFQSEWIHTQELFEKYRSTFHVIIVGDACMNPYELFAQGGSINYWEESSDSGIDWLKRLKNHFSSIAWLNPEPSVYWQSHATIDAISKLIPMFPLTVEGLGDAVCSLKRRS